MTRLAWALARRKRAPEVHVEVREHRRGVRHRVGSPWRARASRVPGQSSGRRGRARRSAGARASATAATARPSRGSGCASRTRPRDGTGTRLRCGPAEAGWWRAGLEPAQHVARADQQDDGVEARVPRQHALENQVEPFGSHAGPRDVPDVHVVGSEPGEVVRRFEQPLKRAGPGRLLVEQVAFRLAAAQHQYSTQLPRPTRQIVTALPITVHVEPHGRSSCGNTSRIRCEPDSQPRRQDVVVRAMTKPPSCGDFGGCRHSRMTAGSVNHTTMLMRAPGRLTLADHGPVRRSVARLELFQLIAWLPPSGGRLREASIDWRQPQPSG